MRPRKIKRIAAAICITSALFSGSVILASESKAGPVGEGCVEDFWMYGLRASTRLICDSDRFADGSWERRRGFFSPRRYVPISCTYGRYTGSCYGGYWLDELKIIDTYPVTDATVLPDEPGWIPSAEPRIVS